MYKRRFPTCDTNSSKVNYVLDSTLKTTILRESSVVDEFYCDNCTNPDGTESISILDPIYLLFNQVRLDNLGTTAAKYFLDSLQPKSDSLAELRSKCSDEDLLTMLKSRHLQSPAEILAWCRYMQSNVDKFNSEVKALVEAQSQTTEQGEIKDNNTE